MTDQRATATIELAPEHPLVSNALRCFLGLLILAWPAVMEADQSRTIFELLSGKDGLRGGVAYHGVLCSPDIFQGGHWLGGYSLTGALVNSGMFRDTFIMAHELGHNFRSHHTHCYNDLPSIGDPAIDRCCSGETRNDGNPCYSGGTSQPADGGSIMSYCHLLPGGYSNVSLSLGEKGAFGVQGDRVLQRIGAHVASVDCLVPATGSIFADGFESGDTSFWSAFLPSPEAPKDEKSSKPEG